MKISRISFSQFKELAPQLTELLSQSQQNQPFLTPEWLISWWEFWGAEYQDYFLLAYQDLQEPSANQKPSANKEPSANQKPLAQKEPSAKQEPLARKEPLAKQQLLGYAPLKLEHRSWLKWGSIRILSLINNQVAADHLDWVSLTGYEQQVAEAFYQYLQEHQNDWDILCLEDLKADSICLAASDSISQEYFQFRQIPGQLCPYLPLQGSWDNYLAGKSKNFRQQTRSKRRKAEKQLNTQWVEAKSPEQIQAALDTLAELNPQRWQQKGQSSGFSQSSFCQFHQVLAKRFFQKGWLDLSYLQKDHQIIAVIYNFNYQNKIYYYNTAFDHQYARHSIGRVLMGYSIENAFNRGLEEFDFLRGIHTYKYEWSQLQRQSQDLIIVPRRIKPRIWDRWNQGQIKLREVLKRYLPGEMQRRIRAFLLKRS